MSKIEIFDPAMCCSTGVCGPSVNKELLRVATTINSLTKKGADIVRHNLTSDPQAFIDNQKVNKLLNSKGTDVLPITLVDGEIIKTNDYLTNAEFAKYSGLSKEVISEIVLNKDKKEGGCCCKGGCC
ncbi:arsenite efflux transporter metallochaperone ArsD [Clostridium senegalense]|uniref:arsenite efflux transporter metallochaperone ArsD n=1 Tax=Clostridium senegalense TaxID=1465809 RepID=UPI001C112488|nr:arsenite efflux transporter metallochaperone ArsD [Clostridium senegalense]MBU5226261.1 arsenite efflux transporter metallochaperone ArsD [Clostridium senegalense]